jgi:hypothetical protein
LAKPSTSGVRLKPDDAVLNVGSGMSADLDLVHPSSEEVVSATWTFTNGDGKAVVLPGPNARVKGGYRGVRATTGSWGVRIWAGEAPSYSLITVKGQIKLKKNDKAGTTRTVTVKGTVRFGFVWGGMTKAYYPYPTDWDIPWGKDPQGRRALALMYDLIVQLPEEIKATAGSMPIARTANSKSADGRGDFSGAHVPFIHDAIQIADSLVNSLDTTSARVMPSDIEFVSTVLHEITHAVTYSKAAWNLHHNFAHIRKYLRNPFMGPIGALPAGVAAVPVLLMAFVKELVLSPPDFVSGYAEAADWELSSPWARGLRFLHPVHDVFDLGNWLVRIPSHGVAWAPLRPNLATGYRGIGGALGLRHRSGASQEAIIALETRIAALPGIINGLQGKLAAAVDPKEKQRRQKALNTAVKELADKQKALADSFANSGLVSDYAAYDVLEDIAETYRYLIFGHAALTLAGTRTYAKLEPKNAALAQRRNYLVREGAFPKRWPKPLDIGATFRSLETELHLENWVIEL